MVKISDLPKFLQQLAKKYDKNKDNTLDLKEYSLFCQDKSFKQYYGESIFTAKRDAIKDYHPSKPMPTIKRYVPQKTVTTKQEKIMSMVEQEAAKWDVKLDAKLVEYWANKAEKIAQKYGVPESFFISVISQETHGNFQKNIDSENGAGPMQVTKISVDDFYPNVKDNRNSVYEKLNPKLLNEILYKPSLNGKKILKFSGKNATKNLRDACAKDDEFGMKVGLLVMQMKFVEAVAKMRNLNIVETIDKLKSKKLKLSEQENKSAMKIALANYNSVFQSYSGNVITSMQKLGYNFQKNRIA